MASVSNNRTNLQDSTRVRKRKQLPESTGNAVDDDEPQPSKQRKTSPRDQISKANVSSRRAPAKSRNKLPITHTTTLNEPPTALLALAMFGTGDGGELGLGPKKTESTRPRANPFLDPANAGKFRVVQVACGGMHTVALTADNKIVTWGVNDNGALGRDTTWEAATHDIDAESGSEDALDVNPHESTPSAISSQHFPSKVRFTQVAAGDSCSLALTDTGEVFGWGTFRDPEGKARFGYDITGTLIQKQVYPVLVPGLKNIIQIVCGANHALALDSAGTIWAWGSGHQHQLGRRLFGRNQDHLKPRKVEIFRNKAVRIASGEYHSLAIDQKDNVWAWGLNSYGQAGEAESAGGDSTFLPHPMKIDDLCGQKVNMLAGGAHHSAAISDDGRCWAWGRMDGGQLGIEFTTEQLADTSIVRYDDRNKPRICLRPTIVSGIGKTRHVACGTDHTIFISRDGKGFSTGFGSTGQLGLGSYDDTNIIQRITGKFVDNHSLVFAGAGGQYSAIAAASP